MKSIDRGETWREKDAKAIGQNVTRPVLVQYDCARRDANRTPDEPLPPVSACRRCAEQRNGKAAGSSKERAAFGPHQTPVRYGSETSLLRPSLVLRVKAWGRGADLRSRRELAAWQKRSCRPGSERRRKKGLTGEGAQPAAEAASGGETPYVFASICRRNHPQDITEGPCRNGHRRPPRACESGHYSLPTPSASATRLM